MVGGSGMFFFFCGWASGGGAPGWFERSAASFAPVFLELFLFFRSHIHPSLFHIVLPLAFWSASPEASKEDLAQNKKTEGLPEADKGEVEEDRQQIIPQQHDNTGEDHDTHNDHANNSDDLTYPKAFHDECINDL
jgi:hypothetical protein